MNENLLKWNSPSVTQDTIIVKQNFAIIEVKPYYVLSRSKVTTLGHVRGVGSNICQTNSTKRHNSLVLKV